MVKFEARTKPEQHKRCVAMNFKLANQDKRLRPLGSRLKVSQRLQLHVYDSDQRETVWKRKRKQQAGVSKGLKVTELTNELLRLCVKVWGGASMVS